MGAKRIPPQPRGLLGKIHDAEPVLSTAGWLCAVALLICIVSFPFDQRNLLGLNPWIKPMKFAISITIYIWTLAWFIRYLPGPGWLLQVVRWGVSSAMLALMGCVWLQSARGVTSHFNIETGFDATIFGIVGLALIINTILIAPVLSLYFYEYDDIHPAYLWGIRLGLFVFFLASLEGMAMIINQAHTIGAADGGPGLPFLNWSTQAGDLRVAHLLGIHALQIIPLVGYAFSRQVRLSAKLQVAATAIFAVIYTGLAGWLYYQALSGRPLLAL